MVGAATTTEEKDDAVAVMNNHNNNVSSGSSSGKSSSKSKGSSNDMSPYVVSLSSRRRVSRNNLLPPLSNEQRNKSSSSNSSSPRHSKSGYYVPHHSSRKTISVSAVPSRLHHHHHHHNHHSGKRSLSASHDSTPVDSVHNSPRHSRNSGAVVSIEKRKVLCTPEKLMLSASPSGSSRKETTVRVLRARPAFYPVVRDHRAHNGHLHRTRARTAAAHAAAASILSLDESQLLQLSQDRVSGKQMTLRTANEKKKRRSAKAPSTVNL